MTYVCRLMYNKDVCCLEVFCMLIEFHLKRKSPQGDLKQETYRKVVL